MANAWNTARQRERRRLQRVQYGLTRDQIQAVVDWHDAMMAEAMPRHFATSTAQPIAKAREMK